MTEIKKLDALDESVHPEFPTMARGGYVEDSVDAWVSKFLEEVKQIIQYQNYGVDVAEHLEQELNAAQKRVEELEAAVDSSVADGLRDELAAAQARIHELENSTATATFPTQAPETVQASFLLQQATKLGEEYVDKAKSDAEQIRHDAEAQLVELRADIENLSALRFATFRSLEDFHAQELDKLRSNALFSFEEENAEEGLAEEAEAEEAAPGVEESADEYEELEGDAEVPSVLDDEDE